MAGPANNSRASVMPEGLFGGPECIGAGLRFDPEQAMLLQLPIAPAMKIRLIRRVDQGDAAFAVKLGQGWAEQRYFAYARLGWQNFDQGAQWPALIGQLFVQLAKAAGDAVAPRSGSLSGP